MATLAIFQALDIGTLQNTIRYDAHCPLADPVLNMLVFGESILNDAVSIVLATTVLETGQPGAVALSTMDRVLNGMGRFCIIFFGSSVIGAVSKFMLRQLNC